MVIFSSGGSDRPITLCTHFFGILGRSRGAAVWIKSSFTVKSGMELASNSSCQSLEHIHIASIISNEGCVTLKLP